MKTLYHYAVLTRPEAQMRQGLDQDIDMENVDYKRQPEVKRIRQAVTDGKGFHCGIIRGGLFGLATNQLALLSAWQRRETQQAAYRKMLESEGLAISDACWLKPTVRPRQLEVIENPGIYVIRWIRIAGSDVREYTELCLQTWPAFERSARARCHGVFEPADSEGAVTRLLMLTWYATLADWEQSRRLHAPDAHKWARRSEMELCHWAEAGRLA